MATVPATADLSQDRKLIAPLWHTLLFIVLLGALALFEVTRVGRMEASQTISRIPHYLTVICFELAIVGYVWFFGLRSSGTTLGELIGGRWKRWTDRLRDAGVAFLFWLIVAAFLIGAHFVIGSDDLHHQAIQLVAPHGAIEIIAWCVTCICIGVCEEIAFRGYLRRQFLALTGQSWAAIALQAIVFGVVHSYQGMRGVITLTGYGALFGILAVRRQSLRPGIMQHSAQDFVSGLMVGLVTKLN